PFKQNNSLGEDCLMNPLNSVKGSITTGVILSGVVLVLVHMLLGHPYQANEMGGIRWLHILSGVMWIGLLWYFNVVQTPGLAAAAADKGGPGGAGVTKYIAPRALLWFRWAAVFTFLTGVLFLYRNGTFMSALTLGHGANPAERYGLVIGLGGWMGTIMAFNVWFFIWPNQKKILGIVPATDEQKAKARKVAAMASRTNFALSIPMLMCMASATHGLPF
ncbi:MAG: urate hydroxylase PuuD, partial [Steroidobacteraceae bacterium]